MTVEIIAESPLAKALQEAVHPKLVEMGWSTGMQDDTLSEYIILMLANGKSEDQIASELSNDLLDLGPDDQDAVVFAHWLFDQVDVVNARLNGKTASNGSAAAIVQDEEMLTDDQAASGGNDQEMGDASAPAGANIPTGPKAMRNGSAKSGRGGRMLGQINKALSQPSDGALHRVRAGPGGGRINSHSREPPKGPRAQQIQRGLQVAAQRPMGNVQMPSAPMGMSMPQMQQPGMMISAQDQMQFMATLAETAQAMAFQMQQIGSQMNPSMFQQGAQNGGYGGGPKPHRGPGNFHDKRQQNGNRMQSVASQDSAMTEGGLAPSGEHKDTETGNQGGRVVNKVPCKFDISCTKADCPFAHHSPAAKPGDALPELDMESECSFGVRCANKYCHGRHPSRAKRASFQAETDCLYGPWCSNPHCSFKHPPSGTKECRNGGDCTTQGCTYWHTKIECKHNPCKNALCKYKHKEGQRQYNFSDHIWKAGDEKKEHVSERKFVQDNIGEEEVILPGKTRKATAIEPTVETAAEVADDTANQAHEDQAMVT